MEGEKCFKPLNRVVGMVTLTCRRQRNDRLAAHWRQLTGSTTEEVEVKSDYVDANVN